MCYEFPDDAQIKLVVQHQFHLIVETLNLHARERLDEIAHCSCLIVI